MSNFLEIFVFMDEKIVIVVSGIPSFTEKSSLAQRDTNSWTECTAVLLFFFCVMFANERAIHKLGTASSKKVMCFFWVFF